MTSKRQTLTHDVFWHVSKHSLSNPADVFALAFTCRDLWALLEGEIYIADVLDVQHRSSEWVSENRCEPVSLVRWNNTRVWNTRFQRTCLDVLVPPAQGRFPPESSSDWIEILRLEHPEGALHQLARNGPISSVRKAIDAAKRFWPEYLDLKGTYGEAPLHCAAWGGQFDNVKLLVESGCTVRAASEYTCWGPRPLHEVINHFTERSAPRVHLRPSKCHSLWPQDQPFVTDALGLAILGNHEDSALFLLQQYEEDLVRSMKEEWLDDMGYPIISPLHLAALMGMCPVVDALIAKGAGPNAKAPCFHRCSPLHMANTREGTGGVIQVLLKHGADMDQVDDQDRTAMQWARAFGVQDALDTALGQ